MLVHRELRLHSNGNVISFCNFVCLRNILIVREESKAVYSGTLIDRALLK